MSDQQPNPLHLNVLPNSGKVDQLRKEMTEKPPQKNLADRTLIDRALDSSKSPQQKAVEEKVIEVLKTVYDPELPVSVYELGLIYEINVAGDNSVHVKMTLTAPACPVAGSLPPEVERRIETIEEVPSAVVELVWDPPWSREMMSEAAQLELGLP